MFCIALGVYIRRNTVSTMSVCTVHVSRCVLKVFTTFQLTACQRAILHFNPFPNKPWFLYVYITSLLKILWEKEKLLVAVSFPFPTVFSTLFENLLPFSSSLKLSSANCFSLEQSEILPFGIGLRFTYLFDKLYFKYPLLGDVLLGTMQYGYA